LDAGFAAETASRAHTDTLYSTSSTVWQTHVHVLPPSQPPPAYPLSHSTR
jgi:hypothetical protein